MSSPKRCRVAIVQCGGGPAVATVARGGQLCQPTPPLTPLLSQCYSFSRECLRLQRRFVMAQRIIELDGLPEPIARGLEVVADMARILAGKPAQHEKSARPTKLSTRKGVV